MKELVQFLAQQLVSHPEAVKVEETQGDIASMIKLRVAKEDLGRVIGEARPNCQVAPNDHSGHRIAHKSQGRSRNCRVASDGLPGIDTPERWAEAAAFYSAAMK